MTDLNDHYEPEEVESSVKEKWNQEDTYERVSSMDADEDFYFLDGPPFTSGRMHCGTAWGKLLKDSFLRYYRMNGYNVLDRPGYDTHGLPVEVKVEQKHDFNTKQDIVDYGVEEFVGECKKYAREQKSVMDDEFKDMGVWMDWNNPYLTMSKDYMETVWSAFYELYNQDLVGRGFDVLNTCPRCETTLSDSEIGYSNRTVTAAYVKFPLKNSDSSVVAWTTTPWTVVGNQFVAVDENSEYALVHDLESEEKYYVAKDCVDNLVEAANMDEYNVEKLVYGTELVGAEYTHPMSDVVNELPEDHFYVQHAEYVESEKTGFVHSAPGFGHEDYERGVELDLKPYSPVGSDGKFTEELTEFEDLYVHDEGSDAVLDEMNGSGYLLATEDYTHEYPECPRCDTDVVFQATEQWFFRATQMKEGLQTAIDKTEWFPQEARDQRFRNTVENAPDWNVSRQRYWGTPLPVWVCEDCGADNVVESSEDLSDRCLNGNPDLDDLHRPNVDKLEVECSECGGSATRIEDVLDVWFDSSVASWGSVGSKPSQNPRPDNWPSNLIVEGHDQTRGWFLMQLYMGVALSDQAPYEDVLMHGFAMLDGKAMSKSRGHVLRPPEVINEHGRDAMRAYMLSNEEQESDVNMTSDMQGVKSMKKKLDVVWNVYRFALMYMDQDDYSGTTNLEYEEQDRTVLDNWVLSRLQNVADESTRAFEEREPHKALESTLDFLVNDVSRYYVKTVRDRVWVTENTADKKVAYDTLSTVLQAGVRLLAPFTPYLSENLYESLSMEDEEFSVHADSWVNFDDLYNEELEREVDLVRSVETAVSKLREQNGRKQRWPVKNVYVEVNNSKLKNQLDSRVSLIKDRTNSYDVTVTDRYENSNDVVEPKMSKFGPQFGADAQAVADRVVGKPASEFPREVNLGGDTYEVVKDMLDVVEQLPQNVKSVEVPEFGRVLVDLTVNDSVRTDGYTRDLVRKAQEMRSDLELDMEDRVEFEFVSESDEVKKALDENCDYFQEEVRVDSFVENLEGSSERELSVNGDKVIYRMKRLN